METKYERSWDRYSEQWEASHTSGDLGVEWGSDPLSDRIYEKFLAPHLSRESRVLEIGPGGGKYTARVAPSCGHLVFADVSQQMLDRTGRRLAGQSNAEGLKLDGFELSGVPDGSMNLVYSIDVFVHLDLEDAYVYLREIRRVLREEGRAVVHFASLLTAPGWQLFVREADLNRADFKQIGRINFVTEEIVTKICREQRFEDEEVDHSTSPRDFLIRLRKPYLAEDRHRTARTESILRRAGGGVVARDLIHELPGALVAAPDSRYVASVPLAIGGDARHFLFQHPPSLVGYALTIPPRAVLQSGIAIDPRVHERCCESGVTFEVRVRQRSTEQVLFSKRLDPTHRHEDRGWHDFAVDLNALAGQVSFLVLETRIDHDPNEFNWSGWGEPAIVSR